MYPQHRFCCYCGAVVCCQANIDKAADPSEWRLDALAAKVVQYCPLLEGLTGEGGRQPLAADTRESSRCARILTAAA
jgi:hypothetical protein